MSADINLQQEDFFWGEPIDTSYGQIRYLKFIEYIKLVKDLNLMAMTPLHFYYYYEKLIKEAPPSDNKEEALKSIEELKHKSLYQFVLEESAISEAYINVFSTVFREEDLVNLEKVFTDEKVFLSVRQLVMDMNFVTEDPVSPNPEIQEYYEERKRLKQREAGKQKIENIVTSIVVGTSNSFNDVKDMTVIQFYSIYYRLGAFKNFDASILFATVSNDVKVEPWSVNIDLFKKEELGIDYNEFDKKYGGLFE